MNEDLLYKVGIDNEDLKKQTDEARKILASIESELANFRTTAQTQRERDDLRRVNALENIKRQQEQITKLTMIDVGFLQEKVKHLKEVGRLDIEQEKTAKGIANARNMASIGSHVGAVASSYQNAAFQGFTDSSTVRMIGSILGAIPLAGPLFQTAANLAGNELQLNENRQVMAYHLQRNVGDVARQTFRTADAPGNGFEGRDTSVLELMERMGVTSEDKARLLTGLGRAGMNPGLRNFLPVAGLEGAFGLGDEANQVMGAGKRAGLTDDHSLEVMGTAMGMAMGIEGFQKGRWGEIPANVTRALSSVTNSFVRTSNILEQELFLNQLGPAYQGATGAHFGGEGIVDALRTGQAGPLSNIMSLRAAGLGAGSDYADSMFKIKTKQISPMDIVRQYANLGPISMAWTGAPKGYTNAKGRAMLILMSMPGMEGMDWGQVFDILEGFYAGAGQGLQAAITMGIGVNQAAREGKFAITGPDSAVMRDKIRGSRVSGAGQQQTTEEWFADSWMGKDQKKLEDSVNNMINGMLGIAQPVPVKRGVQAFNPNWANPGPGQRVRWPETFGWGVVGHVYQDSETTSAIVVTRNSDGVSFTVGNLRSPRSEGKVRPDGLLGVKPDIGENTTASDMENYVVRAGQAGNLGSRPNANATPGSVAPIAPPTTVGQALDIRVWDQRTTTERTSGIQGAVGVPFSGNWKKW